jgi:cephalosporin-C deacetylase-like acetyl esterase
VFEHRVKELFGDYYDPISEVWKTASEVIPTAFMGYALGPDHRSHAPELELGGNRMDFLGGVQAQDEFSFKSIKEAFAYQATGGTDFREMGTASRLQSLAERLDRRLANLEVSKAAKPLPKRLKEIYTACKMLRSLARYYMNRHIDAAGLASFPEPSNETGAMLSARTAWGQLANSDEARYYRPFTERLRMHTNTYHWESNVAELAAIKGGTAPQQRQDFAPKVPSQPGVMPSISWREEKGHVVVTTSGDAGWLLYKPLPSSTYFHRIPMTKNGRVLEARFRRESCGHMIAADVRATSGSLMSRAGPRFFDGRVPSPWSGQPYLIVPSKPGPTPLYYNASEAPTYLRPGVITPAKHGLMVLGTRASQFLGQPVSIKRKILDPVDRGMTLVIFQQDFARYPTDWLPKPLRVQARNLATFDPGGQLGMKPVEGQGMMAQQFLPSEGWEVFGNGGLARLKYGRGEIWATTARLMQNMHLPEAARGMLRLLKLGDNTKPVILIDSGSEGGDLTDSVFPDMMNAHLMPFKTLGEVIADEQGMDSVKAVPGVITADSVLEGQGGRMMTRFLEAKVKTAASRPLPATKAELEARKPEMRRQLMMALGLDPLPPRTPLNARVTGVFARNGYRVEKIVIESRPGFPVTANLYLPDIYNGQKLPVIVNPHGHWQWKKSQAVVQQRAIFQAFQGYIAVVVDSPGWSFEGDTPIERRDAGSHHDLPLILGSANATAIYVWDLMRVMDYLATRPEADMDRVGITGASGGGLATLYAFAAEPRFKVAVPVVYASSMEVEPHNGCLCNHVPGTLQIGDRSDVLAIRAPAPVFVIGATNDGEFPPAGTELTGHKLKKIWSLYGANGSTGWKVFPGPHDYNIDMQDQALRFFNEHLKGAPHEAPIQRPLIMPEPQESKELVCLPTPMPGARTMRDIAAENLAKARPVPFKDVAQLNGGLPARVPLNVLEVGASGQTRYIKFTSEKGLEIPGVLRLPKGKVLGGLVLVHEGGKAVAEEALQSASLAEMGLATLAIDVRGFGELQGLDPRLMAYLGTADAFAMGWDVARAAESLRKYAPAVGLVGVGSAGSQAVMFGALMGAPVRLVVGLDGMREYADAFNQAVPLYAVQPRAMYGAPLSHLRSLVRCRTFWGFAGQPARSVPQIIRDHWSGR